MKKKHDWLTIIWLFCIAAIFFLFGRLSADMTLLVNAGQVAPVQRNYDAICEEVGAQYNICPELAKKYDDLPLVLMVYNGTANAKERWTNGDFTDYANQIMQRTAELEREHGK